LSIATPERDVDYKTLKTNLVAIGKSFCEQRMDESSQIVDKFINEYRVNVKDISSNYQTNMRVSRSMMRHMT